MQQAIFKSFLPFCSKKVEIFFSSTVFGIIITNKLQTILKVIHREKMKKFAWENQNKRQYDLSLEMRTQNILLIFLDSEKAHYQLTLTNEKLEKQKIPFRSVEQIAKLCPPCFVDYSSGKIYFQIETTNKKKKKVFIQLQESVQQTVNIEWKIRKIQRENNRLQNLVFSIQKAIFEKASFSEGKEQIFFTQRTSIEEKNDFENQVEELNDAYEQLRRNNFQDLEKQKKQRRKLQVRIQNQKQQFKNQLSKAVNKFEEAIKNEQKLRAISMQKFQNRYENQQTKVETNAKQFEKKIQTEHKKKLSQLDDFISKLGNKADDMSKYSKDQKISSEKFILESEKKINAKFDQKICKTEETISKLGRKADQFSRISKLQRISSEKKMDELEKRISKQMKGRISETEEKVQKIYKTTTDLSKLSVDEKINASRKVKELKIGFNIEIQQRIFQTEEKMSRIIQKIDETEKRFKDNLQKQIDNLEERITEKIDKKISKTEDQIEKRSREIQNSLEEQRTRLLAEVKSLRSYLNDEIGKIKRFSSEKKLQAQKLQGRSSAKLQEKLNTQIEEQAGKVHVVNKLLTAVVKEALPNIEGKIGTMAPFQKAVEELSAKLVDRTTPFSKNFHVEGNTITMDKEIASELGRYEQILLDVVVGKERPFVFHVHINKCDGYMLIGVVDRLIQRQKQSSYVSGHAICYFGSEIYYGNPSKSAQKYSKEDKGDYLREGMDVWVEVDLPKTTVTFALDGLGKKRNPEGKWEKVSGIRKYQVKPQILAEPARQFVPYVQMYKKGDSISWQMT